MAGYLSFINPSGAVDWFFIGVFALLYLFAVGCAFYAQSTRAKRVSDLGDGASREEVESALYTGYDALVERLPGIFITIGLLGTFLGLGLAVTEAAKALASSSLSPDRLFGEVLQPIGFKFRVSVWGIFFSLLCRLAPGVLLSRQRRSYARRVWQELREQALEREKAAKNQQSSRESRALDVTRQAILKGLKDLASEMSTFFQPVLDSVDVKREALQAYTNLANAIEDAGRDVQSATDRLSVTSADITKSTTALTTAAQHVSGSAVEITSAVTGFRQGLREESEHLSTRVGESVEALGPVVARHVSAEVERLMGATVEAVDNVGVNLAKNVRSAFDDNWSGISDRVTKGFAGLTKKLDGDVREIAKTIGEELQKTHALVERSTTDLQEMLEGIGSNAGRVFEEVTRSSFGPVEGLLHGLAEGQVGLQDHLGRLTLAANQLAKAAAHYESSAQVTLSGTSSAAAKAVETSEAVHKSLLAETTAFRRTLETYGGTIHGHADATRTQTERVDALVRSLQGMEAYAVALKAAADIAQTQNGKIDTLVRSLQGMDTYVAALKASSENAQVQNGKIDAVVQALQGLDAHLGALQATAENTKAQSVRIDDLIRTFQALARALPARLAPAAVPPATLTMAIPPDTSPREPTPAATLPEGPGTVTPSLAERLRLARENRPPAPPAASKPTTNA